MQRSTKVGAAATVALLAAASILGWTLLPRTAAYANHGPNHASFFQIGNVHGLAPGATYTNGWNNTPENRGYFVDVVPYRFLGSPHIAGEVGPLSHDADDPLPRKMEVVRQWRERYLNSANQARLRIWYTIKNVGSQTCSAEIKLGSVVSDV